MIYLLSIATLLITLYHNIGFFIVQPGKQELDGSTIMYWRSDLKLEIIESVNEIIIKSNLPPTQLTQRAVYCSLIPILKKRQIIRLPYYKFLDKTLYD